MESLDIKKSNNSVNLTALTVAALRGKFIGAVRLRKTLTAKNNMRNLLTIIFGALPATWIMVPASMLFAYGIGTYHLLSISVGLMATLGTIGIWKISLSINYKTKVNTFLLSCGVPAIITTILVSIISGEEWFKLQNISTKQDFLALMLLLSPFTVALAYLVVINKENMQLTSGST